MSVLFPFANLAVPFSNHRTLIACLRSLSTGVADALDKAGTFGDLVEKGITELLAPHKCKVCVSVLSDTEKEECGCSISERRMSDDLWYAIENFGPDALEAQSERNIETAEYEFIDAAMEKPSNPYGAPRRQLISSPVTNDLAQCPNAPAESQAPAYSSEWDIFYTDILALPRQDIFPNFYFKSFDPSGNGVCADLMLNIDPIVTPNPDGKKWDTRTNQVSIGVSSLCNFAAKTRTDSPLLRRILLLRFNTQN